MQELSHRHEAEHAWHRAVDVQVLLALTWAKLGQMEPALLALGRAVQRAVPNGMVGPFIEQGEAMEPLLQELGKRPEFADLARLLLASFPGERIPPRAVPVQPLPEPLTDRELEILQLLAGRLSNKEIAHQLTVSPYTVRNHTANIFGKLQVENRHEAVERARGLGLLPSVSQRPAQAAQLH